MRDIIDTLAEAGGPFATTKDSEKARAYNAIVDAATEIHRLRRERDLWHARAFAMFWLLPGEVTIGELKSRADNALAFVAQR